MRIIKLTVEETVNCLLSYHKSNWTHDEAYALANYFNREEKRLGREIDLDLFTIWRDFKRYSNIKQIRISFPDCPSGYAAATNWLRGRAHVISVSNAENDALLIAPLCTLDTEGDYNDHNQ